MERNYDVVVAGGGIAGSITALVLQQSGIRTLVIERGSHPRFAIGESTLPTTTFLLRRMAERYGIPELAEICSYEGLRKNGCAAWPKPSRASSTVTPPSLASRAAEAMYSNTRRSPT